LQKSSSMSRRWSYFFILASFAWISSALADAPLCKDVQIENRAAKTQSESKEIPGVNDDLGDYEAARLSTLHPNSKSHFQRTHGPKVLARSADGHATRVELNVLLDNPSAHVQVIGPFNDWGHSLRAGDTLRPQADHPEIVSGEIEGLTHGQPYRLLVDGKSLLDPSAVFYTTREYADRQGWREDGEELNSVFYDSHAPDLYQTKTDFIDLSEKPSVIGEFDIYSLVQNFHGHDGHKGPYHMAETYRFVAESVYRSGCGSRGRRGGCRDVVDAVVQKHIVE